MSYYGEYTTLLDVKNTVGTAKAGQDPLYADLIRSTSQEIDDITNRRFVPWVNTETYDAPDRRYDPIDIDDDLLTLTALTNGDGTVIPSSAYKLYPLNAWPKERIVLLGSSAIAWRLNATGDKEGAISVNGIYGYHDDYLNAWRSVDTLNGAMSDTTGTTLTTAGSATVKAGQLVQVDSEVMYASAVNGSAVTVVRGVNGFTAATHLTAAPVSVWLQRDIEMMCRYAVIAYERLKNNPAGDTQNVAGYQFNTPKDVTKFLNNRCESLGLERTGFF